MGFRAKYIEKEGAAAGTVLKVPSAGGQPVFSAEGENVVGLIQKWWPPVSTATPPAGYALANGQLISDADSPFDGLRVPDLRALFPRGATAGTYASGQGGDAGVANANVESGGVDTHSHGASTGATAISNNSNVSGGTSIQLIVDPHSHSISSDSNVPARLGFVYIIKIKG